MSRALYYDKQGDAINLETWGKLHSNKEYQKVKSDLVTDLDGVDYLVSTVWLGIDHGFGVSKEPIIFETMVFEHGKMGFDENGLTWHDFCQRYSTEDEAKAGHDDIRSKVANTARSNP